jgi:acyl carrier protein
MQDGTFSELAALVAGTLSIDPETVTPELTADDVESWDSLNHLRLITAVEEHFSVRFSMNEIMGFEKLGDMAEVIEARAAAT